VYTVGLAHIGVRFPYLLQIYSPLNSIVMKLIMFTDSYGQSYPQAWAKSLKDWVGIMHSEVLFEHFDPDYELDFDFDDPSSFLLWGKSPCRLIGVWKEATPEQVRDAYTDYTEGKFQQPAHMIQCPVWDEKSDLPWVAIHNLGGNSTRNRAYLIAMTSCFSD